MNILNENLRKKVDRPIKAIQFGEGNFLRGFVDYMLDILNERTDFNGNIVLIKPIEYGNLEDFKQQNCLYTVSLRGIAKGEETVSNRLITSVADAVDPYREYKKYEEMAKLDTLRFVISNTTEAGIVYDDKDCAEFCPPKSYPGKLTKFLYERYRYFNGDLDKGLVILPVELIDDNGIHLKEIVGKLAGKWEYEPQFMDWLNRACIFCSTLVDRIITGYPRDEAEKLWQDFGYTDHLIVTGEPFALWVIESEKEIKQELPFEKAGLPVVFTDNQKPYKQRKVRILNGAHTSFSLASYLAGNDYVLSSMEDKDIHSFMEKTIYEEIIPTLTLPREELLSFADAVAERFRNPFIKHALLSISLNSVSKWKARCLPSLLAYEEQYSILPVCLTFSLAALMEFYSADEIRDGVLIGHRGDKEYVIQDDRKVLEFFAQYSGKDIYTFVEKFLSNKSFWDSDLTQVPLLTNQVSGNLEEIRTAGIRAAMKKLL
jgi:Mannitol-1-phosphate/altronate dehydrogenases